MKQYNSIEYFGDYWGINVHAFEKLDGSNLRFEYSQKRGFYKYGTRQTMIDVDSEPFGFAIDLFLNKYSENLNRIFKTKQYRDILSFTVYAELVGTKSAFGQHDFENDLFDIILFDIDQYKKGFVHPRKFIDDFESCGIPREVYYGNLNKEFVKSIKNNEYNLSEGVICKGVINSGKRDNLYYCKIKTDDWFNRLRANNIDNYNKEINDRNRNKR